jgi:hypothetical protein
VSAVGCEGRRIWIADAHRDDGKRFIVQADELLTAFVKLESAILRSGAAGGAVIRLRVRGEAAELDEPVVTE